MQPRRWVSYIYRYRGLVRCEIAGFMKIQRIGGGDEDMVRIRMGMKMYKDYPCTCYAYLLRKGVARPFTEIHFKAGERDTMLSSVELPWSQTLTDGAAFPEYEGVYFVCDDGEILAGIWAAENYDLSMVQVGGGKPQPGPAPVNSSEPWHDEMQVQYAASVDDMHGQAAEPVHRTENLQDKIPQISLPPQKEEVYAEMLSTYPKIPLIAGSPIVDGVKIVPQDIGKLDMANWKLGVNSFLAHGYYKYQYLMLGIVKMNREEARVIGVPGIFTNKERYLANMFGFRVFIPVRRTKIMTGNFGYWVSEVQR